MSITDTLSIFACCMSSETLLAVKTTQNKHKKFQKILNLTKLPQPIFRSDDVIKMDVVYQKNSLPKSFQMDSRKSHKTSRDIW